VDAAEARIEVAVERGGDVQRVFVEQSKPITIGRDPECALRLESPSVSRRHAVLDVKGDLLNVKDLSSNGTLVGTRVLRRGALQASLGTPLQIGEFKLTLKRVLRGAEPSVRAGEPAAAATSDPRDEQGEPGHDASPAVEVGVTVRREAHRRLLQNLDLRSISGDTREQASSLRPQVLTAMLRVLEDLAADIPAGAYINPLVG
jgi:pSer/pThr/pTyr-binding forkhead associated (FHA) protein